MKYDDPFLSRNMGGMVIRGRVSGSLAVTRALGDLELKTEVNKTLD